MLHVDYVDIDKTFFSFFQAESDKMPAVAFSLVIVVLVMIVITTIVHLYHRRKLRIAKQNIYVLPAQVSTEHKARGHSSYISLTGLNESSPPKDDDSAVYAEILDSDGEAYSDCYTRPNSKDGSNDDYLQPYNILTKTAERLHSYEALKNTIKHENPNSLSEIISVFGREEGQARGIGNTSETDVASGECAETLEDIEGVAESEINQKEDTRKSGSVDSEEKGQYTHTSWD